jgi:hypothetical protein
MSLIFATQLTAVATAALAVLALAAASVAGMALSRQSRELALLTKQNERDIAERRQAQAAQVFTVVGDTRPDYARPYAENGSDYPVYDAQLWIAQPPTIAAVQDIGMIAPGGHAHLDRQIRDPDALAGIILTFRDAAGTRWIRLPDGTLKEQDHWNARDTAVAAARTLPRTAAAPGTRGDPVTPAPH